MKTQRSTFADPLKTVAVAVGCVASTRQREGHSRRSHMYDPAHLGEIIRDAIEAKGWTVADCATRLGVPTKALSHVLDGQARRIVSANTTRYGYSGYDLGDFAF